jgi:predicted transcriptional regulator
MAEKRIKSKSITLKQESGGFSSIFRGFKADEKYANPDIAQLRSMLSNEKARMLHVLRTKQPNSLYELAKILGRDFKSVRQDIRLLEEFGFVEMIPIHKGKREKLKPILVLDELRINIQI